jgi:hypothetical protein
MTVCIVFNMSKGKKSSIARVFKDIKSAERYYNFNTGFYTWETHHVE